MWSNSSSPMADSDPTHAWHGHSAAFYIAYIQLFNLELIIGGLAIIAVWFTVMLSPTIQRSAAWVNMLVSWIIYALSYLILAFAGQQSGPQPSKAVCLTQAAVSYAAAPLCAAAILALNIEMLLKTFSVTSARSPWISRAIIFGPYVIWVAILIEGLVLALTHHYVVRATWSPYCVFTGEVPGKISAGSSIVLMALGIFAQVVTIVRFWRVTSRLDKGSQRWKGAANLMVRMAVFNVAPIAAIVVAIAVLRYDDTPAPRLVLGAQPLIVFLTFGTKKDIFDAWRMCSRNRKEGWSSLNSADEEQSIVRTRMSTTPSRPSSAVSGYPRPASAASNRINPGYVIRPASTTSNFTSTDYGYAASTTYAPKHASQASTDFLVVPGSASPPTSEPNSPEPLLQKFRDAEKGEGSPRRSDFSD